MQSYWELSSAGGDVGPCLASVYPPPSTVVMVGTTVSISLLLVSKRCRCCDGLTALALMGHESRLSSICFSRDSTMVLAAGDNTLYLWRTARVDGPALKITQWRRPSTTKAAANTSIREAKLSLEGPVAAAEFYFQDKFIVTVQDSSCC